MTAPVQPLYVDVQRIPPMNDPPLAESVRARMQQLRCEIDEDMEDMAASARSMVDWKHYVKTYPWVCLGAAVALGFLIVPKRSTGDTPRLGHPDRDWRGPAIWSSNRRRPPRTDWSMRYWLPSPTSRFARQPHIWAANSAAEDYWE